MLTTEKKAKASKAVTKGKKTKAAVASHPPYFLMIKEAILALHEKTGSSSQAIAKFIEGKHKGVLPGNFRKLLAIQLRGFAAKGKLVKVKASFKLSDSGKKVEKKSVKDAKRKPGPKPKTTKEALKGKKVEKKSVKDAKRKPGPKPKMTKEALKGKVTKVASTSGASALGKRKAVGASKKSAVSAKPVLKKAKKTVPVKPKQPKSIKSPVSRKTRKAVS
ncbi:hypothetical protein HPP92_014628 [Vanilla planifolia]|uniref:H15 domain-containing protein n=1 Tax=Vanilla planifolia TaxID=51239 RepID=A0A835QKT1_VANPL|nr:hypothetical protein HPP92_014628 [Vanilla planifolia]